MIVTATEFKTNFGKYLELVKTEDVFITKNGKAIAKMVNPNVSAADAIRGIIKNAPPTIDVKTEREERLFGL